MTLSAGKSIRLRTVTRRITWLMLAYLVIGLLHGMAPQLWAHHVNGDGDGGPFRVLLFTVFLAAAAFILLNSAQAPLNRLYSSISHPLSRAPWSSRLLRGPPRAR